MGVGKSIYILFAVIRQSFFSCEVPLSGDFLVLFRKNSEYQSSGNDESIFTSEDSCQVFVEGNMVTPNSKHARVSYHTWGD